MKTRACRQIILNHRMIDRIWRDHLIVVASVAKQSRLWIATPLVAARDDEIYDSWQILGQYPDNN